MLRFLSPLQTVLTASALSLRAFVLALCSLPLLALTACGEAPPESAKTRTVLVQTLGQPDSEYTIEAEYSATVRARTEQMLAFQVPGKIAQRLVEVGDSVKAGDVLARLDAKDLKLQQNSAEAQLRATQTQAKLAASELERARALHAKGFLSAAVLDARSSALDAAHASRKQAQAQLELTRNQMRYAQLRAPQAGVIAAVMAESGQVVAPGTPVLQLIEPDQREIEFYIPQNRLHEYRKGQAATIRLHSQPEIALQAELHEIAPTADPMIRAWRARLRLSTEQESLPDGQLPFGATVQVVFQSRQTASTELPLNAVTAINGIPSIWIVDADNHLQTQPVQVSATHADRVEILSGLPAHARVVISGLPLLVAGEKVRSVEANAALALDAGR